MQLHVYSAPIATVNVPSIVITKGRTTYDWLGLEWAGQYTAMLITLIVSIYTAKTEVYISYQKYAPGDISGCRHVTGSILLVWNTHYVFRFCCDS